MFTMIKYSDKTDIEQVDKCFHLETMLYFDEWKDIFFESKSNV